MTLAANVEAALEAAKAAGLGPADARGIASYFQSVVLDEGVNAERLRRGVYERAIDYSVIAPESPVATFWRTLLALELAPVGEIAAGAEALLEGDDDLPR